VALTEAPVEPAMPLPALARADTAEPALLLVTHEDLHPESCLAADMPIAAAIVAADPQLLWGDAARLFAGKAAADAAARAGRHFRCPVELADTLDAPGLIAAANEAGVSRIVTPCAPVGPVADALAGITQVLAGEGIVLAQVRRDWDARFWPHATKGFFPFKEKIPALLREGGLG
jgi:deoxyribodipyrimidine photo-lyase